jgi:hypothetical protein
MAVLLRACLQFLSHVEERKEEKHRRLSIDLAENRQIVRRRQLRRFHVPYRTAIPAPTVRPVQKRLV